MFGRCNTKLVVCRVIRSEEPLEECLAVDEADSLFDGDPCIADDEVNPTVNTANLLVQL